MEWPTIDFRSGEAMMKSDEKSGDTLMEKNKIKSASIITPSRSLNKDDIQWNSPSRIRSHLAEISSMSQIPIDVLSIISEYSYQQSLIISIQQDLTYYYFLLTFCSSDEYVSHQRQLPLESSASIQLTSQLLSCHITPLQEFEGSGRNIRADHVMGFDRKNQRIRPLNIKKYVGPSCP
jgi:hypothetical protein